MKYIFQKNTEIPKKKRCYVRRSGVPCPEIGFHERASQTKQEEDGKRAEIVEGKDHDPSDKELIQHLFGTGRVTVACAHTLPEPSASTRVLEKCGFRHVEDVVDPEDGPVWRWERSK